MPTNPRLTRYEFEPEFLFPVPRPLPDWFAHSEFAQQARRQVILAAASGLFLIALSSTHWTKRLGLFVLPFAYLDFIGLGLIVIALFKLLAVVLHRGPIAYLVRGKPIAAEVLSLTKAPVLRVNGVDARYAIVAEIGYLHPQTGNEVTQFVQSNDFLADTRERYSTSLQVGDIVTAVYLGSAVERSLRLYGFLGLNPQRRFLIDAKSYRAGSHRLSLGAQILVLALFFSQLIANVYAFAFFCPIDFDWLKQLPPFLIGAACLTLLFGVLSYLAYRKRKALWFEQQAAAAQRGEVQEAYSASIWERGGIEGFALKLLFAVGGPLLLGISALCLAFIANGALDRSTPEILPVELTQLTVSTENFILREYSIEFLSPFTKSKTKFNADPAALRRLLGPSGELIPAEALVRSGWLGWRWVADVRPVATN